MHDGEKAGKQIKLLTVLFVKHIDIDTCFASLFCYILLTINEGKLTALDSQTLTTFWTQTARQKMPSPAFSVWQKDKKHETWGYRKNKTTVFHHYIWVTKPSERVAKTWSYTRCYSEITLKVPWHATRCGVISRYKPFWKSAPYDITGGRVHLDV